MKKVILSFCIPLMLAGNVPASEPAGLGMHANLNQTATELSSKIGSTMFAYYQLNYHDQLAVITTLRFCGVEDVARQVIDTVPDLPSFYLQNSSQQLLYDIVYKEAMISGYPLNTKEDFELVAGQSLMKGQSYFFGYLKGYQIAMQKFFDNKETKPFCQAALIEADRYIHKNVAVQPLK